MFKSTTDIKKKRPSHTNVNSEKCHKKHMKGTKVLEDEMICNSLLQRHLPKCQNHAGTQTDATPTTPTIRSYEVKGYSGNKNTGSVKEIRIYLCKNIDKLIPFSLCCKNTWATTENCRKGKYYLFCENKYLSLTFSFHFLFVLSWKT